MFENLDEMKKKLNEMANDREEFYADEDMALPDFEKRIEELAIMLRDLDKIVPMLQGLMDPEQLKELQKALDEAGVNIDSMFAEADKIKGADDAISKATKSE